MNVRARFGAAMMASAGAMAIGLVATTSVAVATPSEKPATAYTCTGGDIPSGTYASITVAGACEVPADGTAVISIAGNLTVEAGAMLDAQSSPSTITVGHNVTAASGSFLGLGCQPPAYTHNSAHQCANEPDGHSTITVNGNIAATDADTVLLNGITVKRNVTLTGGGENVNPWSIKNNAIGGNLTISGVTANWLGVLFNTIGRNATLTDVTATDPGDTGRLIFVVRNTIGRNLNCTGLAPGVTGGAFPGEVNVVGRNATGQCANLTDL